MNEPVLVVRLSAGYGKAEVLSNLAFELHAGDRFGLLGPSGTGKSTLLLAVLGLLSYRGGWAQGQVLIEGKNLLTLPKREARKLRGRALALVPQSPMAALNPALTLQAHFTQCWKAHNRSDQQLRSRTTELLERVHLPATSTFLQRKPGEISVGQAQRCALALALLHKPAVLIADEPTSALDPVSQTEVLDLLRDVSEEEQAAVLFVSHDLLSVLRLCSTIAILAEGRLAEQLPVQDIVLAKSESLKQLLRALPVPAGILMQHMQTASRASEENPQLQMR